MWIFINKILDTVILWTKLTKKARRPLAVYYYLSFSVGKDKFPYIWTNIGVVIDKS